uniref:general transcription factor 3C polypeptide 5-like isoform X2 n=1 Tax=Erigeron canadensis TaxID=72917 RepID=UPI001CB95112|nr:general transcription factor 3C polypeptide 5-like isoform X2 [Erigeron canadensis]
MGVIKDGSISGILPSKSKVFAVNYPGYPSSMDRALVTLGGPENIAKARETPSNSLELRFRPEDPYSHPVVGKLSHCNSFLLKISKHDNTNAAHDTGCSNNAVTRSREDEAHISEEGSEDKLCADIVGHVSEAYYFDGMVDYQHVLAVHADAARKKKRNWADVEPLSEKRGLIDADQEDLMILLPPVFSLKNIPKNLVLAPPTCDSQKKKQDGVEQQHSGMDLEPSLQINFDIKDVPKKVNWESFIKEGTDEWKYQMAICKLFDERPVWVRQSLSEHLSSKGLRPGSSIFKRILSRAAYYFSKGPFQRFWIRKGYDPRKDPESRIYQRIDFRVPRPLPNPTGIVSGLEHKWDDICAFRVFPYQGQTSLQLFELADDYIQQEIRKPTTQTICTLTTGWFPPHIHEMFRLHIKMKFLSVHPSPEAASLVKKIISSFEKLKRTRTTVQEHIVTQDKHRVNEDEVNIEENESNNDEDDGATDDEAEDDMEDEEFDAYEGLDDMERDMANFIPEPSYINQDNISKNYLQELFGSFPNNGGSQDAENSDGEYQIYDQDSDDNDSEDDY